MTQKIYKKSIDPLVLFILVGATACMVAYLFLVYERQAHWVEGFANISKDTEPEGRIIWSYWETKPGETKPGYIDLCQQSLKANCGKCFDIRILDATSVYQYIPEARNKDLTKLDIPHRVDYYRYCLLEKYGGVWLDADMLILQCICPFYDNLEKSDYVGFGCGKDMEGCQAPEEGYSRPLNWFMISRKNTDYMKCIKAGAEKKIDNPDGFEYHGIGRDLLAECHDKLKAEKDWGYAHMPCKCQDFDSRGNKMHDNVEKPVKWDDCIEERIFFPLYNTAPGYPDWFKKMSAEDLKTQDTFIKPLVDLAFSGRQCKKQSGKQSGKR